MSTVRGSDQAKKTDLREQSIQTVELLLFIHKCIILGEALQSELVHEIDFVGSLHPAITEFFDGDGEGRTAQRSEIKMQHDKENTAQT